MEITTSDPASDPASEASNTGTPGGLSPVDLLRIRRRIRTARGFYALIATGNAVLAAAVIVAADGPDLLLALPLITLTALFTLAFARVERGPIFWTRLAAATATVALVLAHATLGIQGGRPGWLELLLQAGVLAALFDAIPRGEAGRRLREDPHMWTRHVAKYG